MKKVALLTAAVVVLGVWSLACAPRVVVVDRGPEVLLPGELIETVDANTILVKCTGIGGDQRAAIDQARRGCLEWVITNQMAHTPGERQAYLAQQQSIFAKLDRYVGIPPPGARSGKGKGVKSQVRVSDREVKVEIITDVHKRALQDDLVAMGVVGSKDDMLAAVGMPVLTSLPFKASKGSQYRGMMEGLVNSYLTKNKWEVVSAEGMDDLNKLVDAIGEVSGAEEDEAAKLAMAVGADVYIKYEAKKEAGKGGVKSVAYSVRVEARESTTARMLGSEQVTSPARADWKAGDEARAMSEALNDAMGKLLPQIVDYWKEDSPKGQKYFVVFKNAPKGTDMKMNNALKTACSQVKLVRSTKSEVVFRAQCKLDNLELSGALEEAISAKMDGAEHDFAAKNRANIIVVFR